MSLESKVETDLNRAVKKYEEELNSSKIEVSKVKNNYKKIIDYVLFITSVLGNLYIQDKIDYGSMSTFTSGFIKHLPDIIILNLFYLMVSISIALYFRKEN